MAGLGRWIRREWGTKEEETGEEWRSGGADWVFALRAWLAKGKPADSTMCHSTFCQQHSKLFLEDGSLNRSGVGLAFSSCMCLCGLVKSTWMHSATHNALLIHIYLPEWFVDISFCLSLVLNLLCTCVCPDHADISVCEEGNMLHVISLSVTP